MRNNKKLLQKIAAVAVCATMFTGVMTVTACQPDEPEGCRHNYTWVDDENGTTCHEHCPNEGCDLPDKDSESHSWDGDECSKCHAKKLSETDRAIIPEYKGEAAGPEAGTKDFTSIFDAKDLSTGTIAANEAWSDGTFTVSGEISGTSDKSGKYSRCVKNGTVKINVPVAGKLTIYFANGSSTKVSQLQITKPDDTSETVDAEKGISVLDTKELDVVPGEYVLTKSANTIYVFACEFKYSVTATPVQKLEVANVATTDYLVTQKVDCTGVSLVAKDKNGANYPVNLENCKFDTSKYNPNKTGEYEIGVTYYLSSNLTSAKKEFTASFKVKVYMVDSIELSTIGLISNKQVTVQQAYLPGGTFSKENLAVIATCGFDGNTIQQKLKSDWVTVSTPSLAAEGTQTVTVSVDPKYTTDNKQVSATYEIAVKAVKNVESNKIEVTVGETGDFKTLTQAVQYLKACGMDKTENKGVQKIIKLQAGTYTEKVWIDMDNVTLIGLGEKADDTSITYSLVEGDADKLSGSLWALYCATVHVTGDNFKAYNLAIRNDFDYMANSGKYSGSQAAQGVALTVAGDCNVIYNCHLYGNQDTFYMKGRAYVYKSQIDGNVDFIFGSETGLAYLEECKIVAINRETGSKTDQSTQNGYVTAPQHKQATKPDYGYIFYKCDLTDDGDVHDGGMALGRPWGAYATVSYIECSFSAAYSTIANGTSGYKTVRWSDMSSTKTDNADFTEYGSTGEGSISSPVAGGSILSDLEVANYTKANIFGTSNGGQKYDTVFDCDADLVILKTQAGVE